MSFASLRPRNEQKLSHGTGTRKLLLAAYQSLKIALALVRLDHVASGIVNANHSIM
jgi:hypothetical protein